MRDNRSTLSQRHTRMVCDLSKDAAICSIKTSQIHRHQNKAFAHIRRCEWQVGPEACFWSDPRDALIPLLHARTRRVHGKTIIHVEPSKIRGCHHVLSPPNGWFHLSMLPCAGYINRWAVRNKMQMSRQSNNNPRNLFARIQDFLLRIYMCPTYAHRGVFCSLEMWCHPKTAAAFVRQQLVLSPRQPWGKELSV